MCVVLMQDKPIVIVSKSLGDCETHYAKIRKEILAVFFFLSGSTGTSTGLDSQSNLPINR